MLRVLTVVMQGELVEMDSCHLCMGGDA